MTLDEIHAGMRDMQVRDAWDLVDFGSSKSALFIVVPVTETQRAWLATWEKRVQLNAPYFAITQQLDGEVSVLVQDFQVLYQRIQSYFGKLSDVVGDVISRILAHHPDPYPEPTALREQIIGVTPVAESQPNSLVFQRTDARVLADYEDKNGSHIYVVTPIDEEQAFRLTEIRYQIVKPFAVALRESPWLGYVQVCGINNVYVVCAKANGTTQVMPFNLFYRDNKNTCDKILRIGIQALQDGRCIPGLLDEID